MKGRSINFFKQIVVDLLSNYNFHSTINICRPLNQSILVLKIKLIKSPDRFVALTKSSDTKTNNYDSPAANILPEYKNLIDFYKMNRNKRLAQPRIIGGRSATTTPANIIVKRKDPQER